MRLDNVQLWQLLGGMATVATALGLGALWLLNLIIERQLGKFGNRVIVPLVHDVDRLLAKAEMERTPRATVPSWR